MIAFFHRQMQNPAETSCLYDSWQTWRSLYIAQSTKPLAGPFCNFYVVAKSAKSEKPLDDRLKGCSVHLPDTSAILSRHLYPPIFSLRSVFIRTAEHDLPSCPGCNWARSFWVLARRKHHKSTNTRNEYQSKSASEPTPRLACSENYAYWLKSNKQ